jgi:LAS superfamily LD-carboxypeptidase LdcB
MNDSRLRTLQPWLRPAAEWLVAAARDYDPAVTVTSARRTFVEQSRLYRAWKEGRSSLPAAPPGRSMHQLGRAFDVVRRGIDPFSDDLLPQMGAAWIAMGGRWFSSDPVHFEA